jgi:3,4-dihydroxy-9,10-secoandrosta-1,3,5(10)-triene-9,17-dione 4,5-dioxygenase
MVNIRELAYVIISSADPTRWYDFGANFMGATVSSHPSDFLYFKLDSRPCRFIIQKASDDRFYASGWLVANPVEYRRSQQKLQEAGVTIVVGTDEEARVRRVREFFAVIDPAGNRHEICWGPFADPEPFISKVGVSRFVTGDLGLGHVVAGAYGQFNATVAFWEKNLGFEISNTRSIGANSEPVMRANWYHCQNGRQHSFALVDLAPKAGCQHIMVQVGTLDDLGRALDRVDRCGFKLARGLGRHVNDQLVSFYVVTPTGFWLEYAYGEEVIDWSKEIVFEDAGYGSEWGHKSYVAMA